MSAINIADNHLDTFYKQNPDFDILHFNLSNQAEVARLDWQGLDQATVIDLLKRYQRLLRLHPDPAVATALLGTSAAQETIFSQAESVQNLNGENVALPSVSPMLSTSNGHVEPLDSAHAIAALPKAQFVQNYSAVVGGEAVAEQLHQNATTVAAKTMLLWANVHNVVASPYFGAMQVNNISNDLHQFENFPDYQELFGSLDFCGCDECASIFGPAAYLVDLMRITDQYITTPNQSTLNQNLTLDARRPDLAQILLTCANTNDLVPYLDIVNTVLDAQAAQLFQSTTPDLALATQTYPFNLPFNLPLEQIRCYLRRLNTDLTTLYKTFNLPAETVAREALGLSIEEFALITTPKPGVDDLSAAYGVTVSANDLGGLNNQDTFLNQTGLSRQELSDLLTQNMSSNEHDKAVIIAHAFYINQILQGEQYLQLATDGSNTITNLNLAALDRLHRFIRLARKLNWSFADLDWVLCSLQASEITSDTIQSIAKIKQVQARLNLPLGILSSFWHDIKTIGVGDPRHSQAPFDTIFNTPGLDLYHPFYQDEHGQLINPLYSGSLLTIPASSSRIAAGLRVSLDDFTTLVTTFGNKGQMILTVQNLSILYRHSLLASLVKLPIDQYLLLLRLTNKLQPIFSVDDLLSLLDAVDWLNSSSFNVYELAYILSGERSKYEAGKYKDENVQPFLQSLQALGISAPPALTVNDIVDWAGFMQKLNNPTQAGPGQRLWSLLTADVQQVISQAATSSTAPTDQQKSNLVTAINIILQRSDFYQATSFTNLDISPQVGDILQSGTILSENELQKLNRLLLEAAYPQEIAKVTVRQIDDEWKEKLIQQLATFMGSTTDRVGALMELVGQHLPLTNMHSYIEVFLSPPQNGGNTSSNQDYINKALDTLSRMLVLMDKLQFSNTEIASVRTLPACYGFPQDFQNITVDNLRSLSTFKQLTTAFQDTQDQLIGYFSLSALPTSPDTLNTLHATLAAIMGWKAEDVREVSAHFQNLPSLLTSVDGIALLKKAFDLSTTMGVNISFHDQILPIATASAKDNWATYTSAASATIAVVKARYNDDDWANISDDMIRSLDETKRSALTELVLWKLGLKNLRTLSEYLLIDVEMTGCASISIIKQAILSMQMYLQRCRMNLEPGVTTVNIPDIWWEWMMNYRIWQANRKVFLYPENYIDPSLRKNKSDLFQELESELLQSNITAESVEAAYQNYFDKFAELAKLRITESYRCFVTQPDSPDPVDTLFLFGRTATEPVTYYYRRCINPTTSHPTWTPWSKIDLSIQSNYISPVFAFHKLFVFWVEIQTTGATGNNQTPAVQKATIKYTFQTLSGKWVQPQTFTVIDAPSGVDLNSADLLWKKVYALAIPANGSEPDKILLMYGDNSSSSTATAYSTPTTKDITQPSYALSSNLLTENASSTLLLTEIVERAATPLPSARTKLAATAAGSQAIFVGGDPAGGRGTTEVDIYDANIGHWMPPGPNDILSVPRSSLAATTVGNLAIFAGGLDHQGAVSNVVDIYNANTGQWTPGQSLSVPRSGLAATTVGNTVIFAGGVVSGGAASNAMDIYNPATTGQWTPTNLRAPCSNIAATSVGSKALFAGKWVSSEANLLVDIYDTTSGWGAKYYSTAPRFNLAATTVGSKAIFAGGITSGGAPSDAVDIYDANINQWSQAKLSVARSNLAATTVGNFAIFAGGIPSGAVASDAVDIYNADTRQWTQAKLSVPRSSLAATTVGNLAIFAGGTSNGGGVSNVVDIFAVSNVIYDNYATDAANTARDRQSQVSHLASNLGLSHIRDSALVLTVKNQPDWFAFNNGDEAFLAVANASTLQPISDGLAITDQQNSLALSYSEDAQTTTGSYAFTRLTTSTIQQLSQKAFIGGIDRLLTPDSQLLPELNFSRFQPSNAALAPVNQQLDFQGAYGLYFQEIFFHIPFLVANTLNTNQRFADAQKWYHYIFNPTHAQQRLVGYWPLNEGSGTTVQDKAGGNNGTIIGTVNWQTVTDLPGTTSRSVLQFGSQGSYVSLPPASIPQGQEITVSFWAFGGSSLPNQEVVIYAGGSNVTWRVLNIHLPWSDGIIYFDCGLDNAGLYDRIARSATPDVYQGVWSHWTFTKNATLGEMSIYLNGKLWYSEGGKTRPLPAATQVFLGCSYIPTQAYDGKIADLRVWNVALSPEDVFASANELPSDRFWRYLPFRGNTLQKLIEILQDNQAIAAYNDDPFDPYAIAQIRIGAYQKAVVMKYIDNLLSWGDSLFAQDTWEAIAQATMLYFLAYDLLGPRPENVGQCPVPAPKRYADLKAQYNGNIPQFLLQLEQQVVNTSTSTVVSPPFNAINAYFCVSENDQFIAYWDRVEDRLYKIRHCQNIAGVMRQLALFEPPINPADLVRAAASGNVAISAVAGLRAEVSNYRFDYLLERAKNITATLMQFGSTLLSVLEKKDAEQLALLRATQEAAILQLIKTTKEKQKKEAEANLASLKLSQKAAQDRYNYYNDLISRGLSAAELSSLALMGAALVPQYLAGGLNLAAAVIFAFVPTIYGAADGGQSPGWALSSLAGASEGAAAVLNQGASLAATIAQYARRTEEWQLQGLMAQDDVNLISQQIDPENGAAQIAIDIAQSELDAHLKSIEQANEVEDFLKRKFSNQDLYQWMVNRLSVLYFQTFKLALDMALVVQKAYQYELNRDDTYISFDYWDNLKQGLLAGEGLMLGLNQLEKAYMEGNVRRLEIEKTISLLQLDPRAFLDLKTSGKCQFQLSERLFDYDFPGHYCRQIKSIALTIPAVVGPYQNIHATLTQLSDRVLVQPNEGGVNYLLNGGDMPDASILRSSWRRNQKIAISRGVNDAGLFELNFRDERYLPFEGTGAVSTWELSMPKATNRIDFESLSDVIIHLSYTALDAGDSAFTAQVQSALNPYKGAYYMSFNQTFSGPWHTFLSTQTDPKTRQLKFSLSNQIIPPHITNVTLTSISLKLDVPDGALTSGAAFLSLQIGNGKPMQISFLGSNLATLPVNPPVDQFAGDWVMSVDLTNAPQALIKNGFLDPAVVQNIECILWYQGEISWNS